MTETEITKTVGLTEETHGMLQRLKENKVFDEMSDGYRLGIALAISRGGAAAPEDIKTRTFVNIGTLDPDGSIRDLITELYPEHAHKPYDFAERLAEAGVAEMGRLHQVGELRFGELFDSAG